MKTITVLCIGLLALVSCRDNTPQPVSTNNETSYFCIKDVDGEIFLEGYKLPDSLYAQLFWHSRDTLYPIQKPAQYKHGGREGLQEVMIQKYYNSPLWTHREYNAYLKYCIFFDRNLRIKDIRIYKRLGGEGWNDNSYDDFLIKTLYETDEEWEPAQKDCDADYYLFIGRFHIT